MRAMFAAFAGIIVIAGLAWFGLKQAGFSTEEVHSSQNVRLD